MDYRKFPAKMKPLLTAPAGSSRYGYKGETSDLDFFILSESETANIADREDHVDYFIVSVSTLRASWGHPLLMGNLTGGGTGNQRLCEFLAGNKREIAYAAPAQTAQYGLDYIAAGERYGYFSPIKAGLRTAMILSHMSVQAEDPFLLSEAEKAILLRARTGDVPPEERVDIYRRTISPETINRLMKMPDHPTIKDELFRLIEEEIQSM